MKKEDVPQDDEFSHNGKFKEITYAVSEDGKFEEVLSVGYNPKNAALRQAWEEADEMIIEAAEQVLRGEKSPIAFYMEKNLMDLKILSQYMELPKRRVKKHLLPSGFEKLEDQLIKQYADVFKISIQELKDIESIKRELEKYEN